MTAITRETSTATARLPEQHIRPVNIRTDLAALADLIELVFASSMDESGRAAIREMRTLSRMGAGLGIMARLNMMTQGMSMGYVWVEDARLVGNVSIYPVDRPMQSRHIWIIANVGVHPEYRRRGIAQYLMNSSLQNIRGRGGKEVILQVDYENHGAIALYERLGFVRQRAFATWRRSSMMPAPRDTAQGDFFITRRRPAEWQQEYALLTRLRPAEQGGIGWMKPPDQTMFRKTFWQRMMDWFLMRGTERLIIRDDDETLKTVMWVNQSFAASPVRLSLFVDTDLYLAEAEAMLHYGLRRFRNNTLIIEHPYDDEAMNDLLKKYRFTAARRVWHMWKALD